MENKMNGNAKRISKTKTRTLMIFALVLINALAISSFFIFLYVDEKTGGELFACSFHDRLGIYCPGCGITRAVRSLMHFDILSSLKYNPCAIILLLIVAYYEARAIMSVVYADISVFLKSKAHPLIFFAATVIFVFLVRNILLFFFGIDVTGDFLH